MFGGTRCVIVWLIIRMIGRSRGKRSFCGGETSRGVASIRARQVICFVGVVLPIKLQRGMQRPSARGVISSKSLAPRAVDMVLPDI